MNDYTIAVNWLDKVYDTVIKHAGKDAPVGAKLTKQSLEILKAHQDYDGPETKDPLPKH